MKLHNIQQEEGLSFTHQLVRLPGISGNEGQGTWRVFIGPTNTWKSGIYGGQQRSLGSQWNSPEPLPEIKYPPKSKGG